MVFSSVVSRFRQHQDRSENPRQMLAGALGRPLGSDSFQDRGAVDEEGEAPATRTRDAHEGKALLEPTPQRNEARIQVASRRRRAECRVEPQLAQTELRATSSDVFAQQLPQDATRQGAERGLCQRRGKPNRSGQVRASVKGDMSFVPRSLRVVPEPAERFQSTPVRARHSVGAVSGCNGPALTAHPGASTALAPMRDHPVRV